MRGRPITGMVSDLKGDLKYWLVNRKAVYIQRGGRKIILTLVCGPVLLAEYQEEERGGACGINYSLCLIMDLIMAH